MSHELRWNPFVKWWVMYSAKRQGRPLLPKDVCPFCPEGGKVPKDFDILRYDNDFPMLKLDPPEERIDEKHPLYKSAKSYGKCEVILYAKEHKAKFYELSDSHLLKLVELWVNRYKELGAEEHIKYVHIFENRGEAVGVTIHHPHGQIYGYPFIPKRLELELESFSEYNSEHKKCMLCDMYKAEMKNKSRIVFENEFFVVFVPYFAEYPYQTYVVPKRHIQSIDQFSEQEKVSFVVTLKTMIKVYDSVFDMPFPYMMCFHQKPTDGKNHDYYHFRVEFYPPMRNKLTQKFNAGSETGAWAHGNPTSPEEKAEELRNIFAKVTL